MLRALKFELQKQLWPISLFGQQCGHHTRYKQDLILLCVALCSFSPIICCLQAIVLQGAVGNQNKITPLVTILPALIAKSASIANPIVYAISHPKYRLVGIAHITNNSNVPKTYMIIRHYKKKFRGSASTRNHQVETIVNQVVQLSLRHPAKRHKSLIEISGLRKLNTNYCN